MTPEDGGGPFVFRDTDAPMAVMAQKRQQRSLRLSQNSLFCDVAEVRKTSAALIGIIATLAQF